MRATNAQMKVGVWSEWARLSVVVGLCGALAACGSSTPTTPAGPTVKSVAIGGNLSLTAVGQTSQLAATATLSDGTTQTVTSTATWQSSNTAVATVSATGLLSSVGYGTATITAVDAGVNGTAGVTIALNVNGTWTGTGTDSNGTEQFSSVVLTQTGGTVTGSVTAVRSGLPFTAAFSGTVATNGATLSFTMVGTTTTTNGTCAISITGTGQVNNTTFTMQYTATTCAGPITNGQITLTPK
jgi:hypothetical protein